MRLKIKSLFISMGVLWILGTGNIVFGQEEETEAPKSGGSNNDKEGSEDPNDPEVIVKCKHCRKDIRVCVKTDCRKRAHPKPLAALSAAKRKKLTMVPLMMSFSGGGFMGAQTGDIKIPDQWSLEDMYIKTDQTPENSLQMEKYEAVDDDPDGARFFGNHRFPSAEKNPVYTALEARLIFIDLLFHGANMLIILKTLYQLGLNFQKNWKEKAETALSNFGSKWLSTGSVINEGSFGDGFYILWVQNKETGYSHSALIVINENSCLAFILESNLYFQQMAGSLKRLKLVLKSLQQATNDAGIGSYLVELHPVYFEAPLWGTPGVMQSAIDFYEQNKEADEPNTASHSQAVINILSQDLTPVEASPNDQWVDGMSPETALALIISSQDDNGDIDLETLQGGLYSVNWLMDAIGNTGSITDLIDTNLVDGVYFIIIDPGQMEEKTLPLFIAINGDQVNILAIQLDSPSGNPFLYRYTSSKEQFYNMLDSLDMFDLDSFSLKPAKNK